MATQILKKAVESYLPYLQCSGEMFDPVFGEPTQYGTPYHALCQAVLALKSKGEERELHMKPAFRGLQAALSHVADPAQPPTLAGFSRVTGTASRTNHRDFFWPAILKTWLVLKELGAEGLAGSLL